jgi:hypothetical protein
MKAGDGLDEVPEGAAESVKLHNGAAIAPLCRRETTSSADTDTGCCTKWSLSPHYAIATIYFCMDARADVQRDFLPAGFAKPVSEQPVYKL